jgi:myosin heavy subunit
MISPASYLQTLAEDETIAFVASLQSVKAYLSQELQWINEQVQQKTRQLQGIETLLSEALALGRIPTNADSVSTHPSIVAVLSTPMATTDVVTYESDIKIPAAIAALPNKASSQSREGQGKSAQKKTLHSSKSGKTPKASAAKTKRSNSSVSSGSRTGRTSELNQFLRSQFRGKALTESVSHILDRASAPLNTDEIMAELYEDLSTEDYQRAKHSLANILSMGKSKGAWQSAGRGRYADKARAISA